jgi:hypothetical protein
MVVIHTGLRRRVDEIDDHALIRRQFHRENRHFARRHGRHHAHAERRDRTRGRTTGCLRLGMRRQHGGTKQRR